MCAHRSRQLRHVKSGSEFVFQLGICDDVDKRRDVVVFCFAPFHLVTQ